MDGGFSIKAAARRPRWLANSSPVEPDASRWSGPVSGSVDHRVDRDGWLRQMLVTAGADTSTITFGYDDDGLLTSAGALTLVRDPDSGRLDATALIDVTTAQSYAADNGDLAGIEYTHCDAGCTEPTVIADFDLDPPTSGSARNGAGQLQYLRETIDGVTRDRSYEYDAAGRLWAEYDGLNYSTRTLIGRYTYDENGNRISVAGPGIAVPAEQIEHEEQDRLVRYGDRCYEYPAYGERWREQVIGTDCTDVLATTEYRYDVHGNLRRVILPYLVPGREFAIWR